MRGVAALSREAWWRRLPHWHDYDRPVSGVRVCRRCGHTECLWCLLEGRTGLEHHHWCHIHFVLRGSGR